MASSIPVWAWIALINAAAVIAWVLIYVDELRPHARDTAILAFTVIGCVVLALVLGAAIVGWLVLVETWERNLRRRQQRDRERQLAETIADINAKLRDEDAEYRRLASLRRVP